MKVIFLNAWGPSARDELVPYIGEQAIDTDIFCLQDATDNVKLKCANALADYYEIFGHKHLADGDNFSQSIFVKNGIELGSSGTLFAYDVSVGLANYIEIKHGDKHVYVCNVHGRSRPGEKLDTPERLKFSEDIIDYFRDKEGQVIIGGDFNLEYTSKSEEMFGQSGYRDLIKEFDIKTTRNHLVWDRFPDNKMCYSDYVFINDKVQLQGFEVQDNEVSDHLPMILRIDF